MYKISMVSLGCPKNQVDAEMMLATIKKAGYEILPKGEYETCVNKKKFCAWMYRFMFSNFIGKLCISDHAMSAREEFMMLESEFEKLKNETGIETEAYDKLKVDFLHYTR